MIIREIKNNPDEIIRNFDWFNDYRDTRKYIICNSNDYEKIVKKLDNGYKKWLEKQKQVNIKYNIGYTNCYIHDHNFNYITEIPSEVALAWVKKAVPEIALNSLGSLKAKYLTLGGDIDTDINVNGWLNKLFVIVSVDYHGFIAINNHDGKFSIQRKII